MQPVIMAPKNLSTTKHKNQTKTAPKRKPDKRPEENRFERAGRERQAAPNPGEHAIGVRLQGVGVPLFSGE